MKPATLNELAAAWRAAKAAEAAARDERLAIEEQMLALLPKKDEGSVTDADSGVTVSYKLTRTVDAEELQGAWHDLPEHAQRAFRWKADVDLKALRGLQEFDAEAYAAAARFITAKPAKPTINLRGE